MELVYLWVEEYKNIKKQGFNFSPKFSCEYNEKNNELDIFKNDDYLKKFFGNNISITAIVGENGSGKSSIYKLILMIIYYEKHKELDRGDKFYSDANQRHYNNKKRIEKKYKNKTFLIINDNDVLKTISIGDELPKNIPKVEKVDFFSTYFNYMIDTLYDKYEDKWINEIYHKSDNYDTPLLIQPNKHDIQTNNDSINMYMLDYLTKQKILKFYSHIGTDIYITSFFDPNKIRYSNKYIHHFRLDLSKKDFVELGTVKKISEKIESVIFLNKWDFKKDSMLIGEGLKHIEEIKDYEYMNLLYIAFKIFSSDIILFKKTIYNQLESEIKAFIEKDKLPAKKYLQEFNFREIINVDMEGYNVLKLKISIDFHERKIYKEDAFINLIEEKPVEIYDAKSILEYIPAWMDIEFLEDNKSFESLSSGEKLLFRLVLDLMYQFSNVVNQYATINFFLDETELGLHPQWQKRYVLNILESLRPLLKKYEKNIVNIYFATHSPFILSDIPKENVIFLKDGSQISALDKKQTFGANIHTLLSDGFFMSDGLIGAFSKEKIDDVINYLNNSISNIKDNDGAQALINIIGEPIIKNQLQKMLDSKRLSKMDEIDLIQNQIEQLTKRLDEIDNGKN